MTATDLSAALHALQLDYTARLNGLLENDRDDVARELSDRYVEDAAALVASYAGVEELPIAS